MRPENDRKAYVVNFCWILAEEMAEKYQLNYSYTFGNIKEHEKTVQEKIFWEIMNGVCLLYTSPSPRDQRGSRMPSSA